jgi:hypothetical protein
MEDSRLASSGRIVIHGGRANASIFRAFRQQLSLGFVPEGIHFSVALRFAGCLP